MAQYATTAQLQAYLPAGSVCTEPDRLLQRASELLDASLMGYTYAVDANGAATDATVITAFQNAVCAQVQYWLSNNDELNETGQFDSYTFEGASFTGTRKPRLCEQADAYLRVVPTINHGVVV